MNGRWREVAAGQLDLVARWQLLGAGFPLWFIEQRVADRRWRMVMPGVYATNAAPITALQRRRAATLTAPSTWSSFASAGDQWGFRPMEAAFEVVTRPGSGGPKRLGDVLVCRSSRLVDNVTVKDGIPITTPERTLIDLAGAVPPWDLARATREAIRLRTTTPARINGVLLRHRGARGTRRLRELAIRYAPLKLHLSRSDAESYAQELVEAAGRPRPEINVRIAGEEADLVWREHRLIIEVDGPQYHLFAEEDARKQRLWETAGWTVLRISSDDVYHHPERLLALAPTARTFISPAVRPAK